MRPTAPDLCQHVQAGRPKMWGFLRPPTKPFIIQHDQASCSLEEAGNLESKLAAE